MTAPSPFHVAREASNNLGSAFKRVSDENAIEKILAQAMNTGNPEIVQNSIGQILSQVSPERQGVALQYLQNTFSNLQQKQEKSKIEARDRAAAQEAGYTYGAPPQVQGQQVKDKAKSGRLSAYGLGGQPAQQGQSQPGEMQPSLTGNPANPAAGQPPQAAPNQVPENVFKKLSKEQLIIATGAPDREISEPAKAELKQREHDENLEQNKNKEVFKHDLSRSSKVKERAEEIALQIPQKRSAISLMKDAVANRNLGFFSGDNLAELTGIEGFRSPEGAIFKTAGKEYFLGNIARAGARPNQWIEQQIADMMAKIGRSPEANLSVLRALENELDLDEARVRLTEEISDRLTAQGDLSQGKLGSMLNKELSAYAEKKQDVLFNDLRAIKAIAENEPQKFRKVEKGTQVSDYMAQALLKQFNNDPKKASEEAKKLGYEF